MANDLLEREEPVGEEPQKDTQETPAAAETAGYPASPSPDLPGEDKKEPMVFAPSIWERGGDTRKAQREADRQREAADREAKKLELQLAREERKAREEERRQEQKRLDEERRQERKAREEADRLFRQEEKAKQKTVRRVGTMTLGLSLIAIGVAVLLYMINPGFDLRIAAYLAPIILIGLGLETLIRYFFSKDRTYRFDFASGVICILLVIGSCFIALIPELMYYISPRRFAAEEQLLQTERDKVYQALQGEQRIADYYVYGGVEAGLPSSKRDEAGNWIYELSYTRTNISLLDSYESEQAFAQVCRELLDKLLREDLFRESFSLCFSAPQNEEGIRYELRLGNRLQLEMNTDALTKLVDPIYSRPTIENGWLPGGYEDLAASFGLEYANQFAHLMENYSQESAEIYYNLLMNDDRPDWAESYFEMVTGQEGQEPPAPLDEGEDGNETVPVEEGEDDEPPEPDEPDEPTETPPAHAAG